MAAAGGGGGMMKAPRLQLIFVDADHRTSTHPQLRLTVPACTVAIQYRPAPPIILLVNKTECSPVGFRGTDLRATICPLMFQRDTVASEGEGSVYDTRIPAVAERAVMKKA